MLPISVLTTHRTHYCSIVFVYCPNPFFMVNNSCNTLCRTWRAPCEKFLYMCLLNHIAHYAHVAYIVHLYDRYLFLITSTAAFSKISVLHCSSTFPITNLHSITFCLACFNIYYFSFTSHSNAIVKPFLTIALSSKFFVLTCKCSNYMFDLFYGSIILLMINPPSTANCLTFKTFVSNNFQTS